MGARDRKGTMQYSLISRVLEKVLAKAARKETMQLVLKDNYALGYLFQGAFYEANLDKKGFALLKEATAIIDDLEHMPRIEQDSLRLITLDRISGAIFTIGAAADTLPRRARTPNLHNIVDCSIFLSMAANATGYHQKVEELRSIASNSIQFALDSMGYISRYEHRKMQDLLYYGWRLLFL